MPLTRRDAILAAIAVYVVQVYTKSSQTNLYCLMRILIAGAFAALSLGAWPTFTASTIKMRGTAPHEQ